MNCSCIELLLTPAWNGAEIASVTVHIRADVQADRGETLFSLNKRVTNKSFVRLDGAIEISDVNGPLKFRIETETPMHMEVSHYKTERITRGTITVAYTAVLSPVGDNPCFDLGYERDGMTGSGMTFLPLFASGACNVSVDWDLSQLPRDFRGVWTYGSGKVTVTGPPSMLTEAFFCAGKLKSLENGRFGFYWIENPDYNAAAIAEWNRDAYAVLSRFFHDECGQYSIFIRRGKDTKPGGTALGRSYMMIYPDNQLPTMNKFIFAHEMIHNWIQMHDEPFGACTWYVEGMAEYYSTALLWRNSLISRAELAAEMNERARRYYENPHIRIKNEDAGALLFTDLNITRVPYGRGLFYLLETDARIRKATHGKQSLDDVLFNMMARYRQNPKIDNRDWLEEITRILGDGGKEAFEHMRSGVPVIPADDCFNHAIRPYQTTGTVRGTGEPCELWQFE